jgi:choloylglycine hydrolase
MNEKGLVIEEANYTPSRYPRGPGPVVNEFQWIQYHLDTCADTAEVLASLKRLRIVPILARVHYLVCDAAGRAAVVEFIAGKVRVYTGDDLPVPVMTNTSYANSLKSLAIHRGFGGTRAVGDGPESPERFVRAATWIRGLTSMPGTASAQRVFRILEAVAQHDTQWGVVYDPVHLVLQFRTRRNPSIRSLGLVNCDFQGTVWTADMNAPGRALEWKEWTFSRHTLRLKNVFARLVRQGEAEAASAIALRDRLIAYGGTLP